MSLSTAQGTVRFRHFAAALMTILVFITSSSISVRAPSAEKSLVALSEFVNYSKSAPKPCQKALIPGALTTCSLLNFSLNAVPAAEPEHAIPASLTGAHWRMSDTSLQAQCGGFSPYRPPCLIA